METHEESVTSYRSSLWARMTRVGMNSQSVIITIYFIICVGHSSGFSFGLECLPSSEKPFHPCPYPTRINRVWHHCFLYVLVHWFQSSKAEWSYHHDTELRLLFFQNISNLFLIVSVLATNFIWPGSSVGIATGYELDGRDSIPGKYKRVVPTSQCPDPFWGPPSLIPNRHRGLFARR
jgi:hypothetical protein